MKKSWILLALAYMALGISLGAQDRGLSVVARQITGQESFDVGRQYAVIIGIDRYQSWMPLKGAVAEARNLKKVLEANYYIDEFIELYNEDATAVNIRKLFTQGLPAKLGVHDSLLLFYAGHGHLDDSQSGFWIPVDGGTDTLAQDRWLPNAQLRNYLGQLKAQRVLVMADSCFSGDLLNATRGAAPTIDSAYFKRALQMTSRQVLSSGASETVPDDSEFARQLLGYLERNTEPVIDALGIYERIRTGMTKTLPMYGTLPGNENGASFVLFRKAPAVAVAVAPSVSPEANPVSTRIATLQSQKMILEQRLGLVRNNARTTETISTIGWVTGVVGVAVSAGSYFWGLSVRTSYDKATTAAVAIDARNTANTANLLFNVGLIGGGTGIVTGLGGWLLTPNSAPVEGELNTVNLELVKAETQK